MSDIASNFDDCWEFLVTEALALADEAVSCLEWTAGTEDFQDRIALLRVLIVKLKDRIEYSGISQGYDDHKAEKDIYDLAMLNDTPMQKDMYAKRMREATNEIIKEYSGRRNALK